MTDLRQLALRLRLAAWAVSVGSAAAVDVDCLVAAAEVLEGFDRGSGRDTMETHQDHD